MENFNQIPITPEKKEKDKKPGLKRKAFMFLQIAMAAAKAVSAEEADKNTSLKQLDSEHGGNTAKVAIDNVERTSMADLMKSFNLEGDGDDDLDFPNIQMPSEKTETSQEGEGGSEKKLVGIDFENGVEIKDEGDHYTLEVQIPKFELKGKDSGDRIKQQQQIEEMGGEPIVQDLVKKIQKQDPTISAEDAREKAIKFLTEDVLDPDADKDDYNFTQLSQR